MDDATQTLKSEIEVLKPKNLTKKIQDVKLKEIPKYWDRDVINLRLNVVSKPLEAMFLRFLWMTGLRVSEVVGLKKADLDFVHYTVRIKWLKSRKYKERNIPMHPRLRDSLMMYSSTFALEDRLFPFTRQRGWQICQKWMQGHPHQLRHSYAVNFLRCGGNVVDLHNLLGHNKIQTTMEYLKIVPSDLGKEILKIQFD